jgi:hypothetical protein
LNGKEVAALLDWEGDPLLTSVRGAPVLPFRLITTGVLGESGAVFEVTKFGADKGI